VTSGIAVDAGRMPEPRRSGGRGHRQRLAGLLFVAPFMVLFAAMLVAPLAYAAYLSLFRDQIVGGSVFAGLDNYAAAMRDPFFRSGVGRVALFLAVQVPVMLTLALFSALALDSGRLAFARLVRIGIFLPYAVPAVVAALMWGYLYGPDFGPLAQTVTHLGGSAPPFLSDRWMLTSLGNIVTWEFVGYNMIIMYAALRAVPDELSEAAAVDGAGAIRIAWSVKIPAIRPAILLTVIFSVIGSFQLFNEPKIMTTIAPSVIGSGYTPNLYAYNLAFTNQEINYAAAVSFLLGAVVLVVSYAVILLTGRRARS
jgi:multiple sugar transport system permease protein